MKVFTSTLTFILTQPDSSLLVLLLLLLLFLVFLGFGLLCFVLLDKFLHFLQLQHFDAGLAVLAGQSCDLHYNSDTDRHEKPAAWRRYVSMFNYMFTSRVSVIAGVTGFGEGARSRKVFSQECLTVY